MDGRTKNGTMPLGVLTRLASEIAYAQKRQCLRHLAVEQSCLEQAAKAVEEAIQCREQIIKAGIDHDRQ